MIKTIAILTTGFIALGTAMATSDPIVVPNLNDLMEPISHSAAIGAFSLVVITLMSWLLRQASSDNKTMQDKLEKAFEASLIALTKNAEAFSALCATINDLKAIMTNFDRHSEGIKDALNQHPCLLYSTDIREKIIALVNEAGQK